MMSRFGSIASLVVATACGGGVDQIEGLAFHVNDVAYSTFAEADGNRGSVLVILSDSTDVCDGGGLEPGQSTLVIYRRWTGSAAMVLESFDDACGVERRDLSGQGWVSLEVGARDPLGVEFLFPGPDGILQGSVNARQCDGLDPLKVRVCDR